MSKKLKAECEWLKKLRSGFRYMATVHSFLGAKVYEDLGRGRGYYTKSLRLRHWETKAGEVTHSENCDYSTVPVYDFQFVHSLYHMSSTDPECAVLGTWHLVAHEWSHFYLAQSERSLSEEDAELYASMLMREAGFSENECKESLEMFYRICREGGGN